MIKLLAICTKGLEEICLEEIKNHFPLCKIISTHPKKIVFEIDQNSSLQKLNRLQTVDDILLSAEKFEYNPKTFYQDLSAVLNKINWFETKNIISKYRPLNNNFSITSNFVSVKLSSAIVEEVITKSIISSLGYSLEKESHENFDIRISVDDRECFLGVRINQKPVYYRKYKDDFLSGALKTSIAGAMVFSLFKENQNKAEKIKIVDNFCGNGTILAEAKLMGTDVYGGDIDPQKSYKAKNVLKRLGVNPDNIKTQDAQKTKWQNTYFDYAISNFPWDQQIEVNSISALYKNSIKEYARILKPNGKLCLLGIKPEIMVKFLKEFYVNPKIEQYKIGYLGQNPTMFVVN